MIIKFDVYGETLFLEVDDAARFVTKMYAQNLEGYPSYKALLLLTEPPSDGAHAFGRSVLISSLDSVEAVEEGMRFDEGQVYQGHSFA